MNDNFLVIVPDSLNDAINKKLDDAYAEVPEAAVDRQYHYRVLLNHFDEHGALPDFQLVRKEQGNVKAD